MIKNKFNFLSIALLLVTYSCTGVQEYVFPSLSDEEVAAPPALEEVPQAVEELGQANVQEIPPSQYAPPPTAWRISHATKRDCKPSFKSFSESIILLLRF